MYAQVYSTEHKNLEINENEEQFIGYKQKYIICRECLWTWEFFPDFWNMQMFFLLLWAFSKEDKLGWGCDWEEFLT